MARIGNESIKVKMRVSRQVSIDGIKIIPYIQGVIYELTPDMAKELVGAYDVIKEDGDDDENKNEGHAPVNKMTRPKENK